MILFSGFLEVLLHAFALVGLSLAVGGIVFIHVVLRPRAADFDFVKPFLQRALKLVFAGSVLIACSQAAAILIAPWALADELGRWPLKQFLMTFFARAGLIHTAFAVVLAVVTAMLIRRPHSRNAWFAEGMVALLLVASGAWLVHGASRLHYAASLMATTVLHQAGAALWIGGVVHMMSFWRLLRHRPEYAARWPAAVSRFSSLALFSVALLSAAAVYLALSYIANWGGLIGTAYGVMVLTKVALMACVLGFGALNFFSVRQWKRNGGTEHILERTPISLEVEAVIGVIILFSAAGLTSQPPAIDIVSDRATPAEVAHVFTPKVPQLTPPPYQAMLSQAASSFDLFATASALDRMQSNFNHNISGVIVLLAGILSLLFRTGKASWARHWPLLFLVLTVFLLVYAEPNGWPLGNEPFWGTLIVPGVLQHRLATLVVTGLAVFEWRVRAGNLGRTRWVYAFPFLCIAGGGLLLTHSHTAFALKELFLIEVSHAALGVLAVLAGASRLLEIRFPRPANRYFGYVWPVCLILVGFVLLFYREV